MSGETVPSPGCILRMFPQYPFSPLSRPTHRSQGQPPFSPMLSSSHLSHHHRFSEEKLLGQKRAQKPRPPAWEAPLPSKKGSSSPSPDNQSGSRSSGSGEGRALTLGVLSWVQSPSAQSWRWISQAKRAGHSPFSWAIRATTGGVARRGLLPPIPLGSKTPVR